MEASDQSNPCAICLGGMDAGGGQAIFTAECSHTFHFHCISTNVAHGHRVCPLCNSQWRELPFERPPQPAPPPPLVPLHEPVHHVQPQPIRHRPMHHVQPPFQPAAEPEVFDDDDQVDPPTSGHDAQRHAAAAASGGALTITTHTEYSAVARDTSHDNFAVLVHVKAPGMIDAGDAPRAPLDLVTVLDVSGSMSGEKLALVKQAMGFVIDSLGPHDRLAVVAFSSGAHRVTRLLRMSDAGKGQARTAVESLVARGGTNISEGLRTAAKVLDERRHRNAVSSVILLSDGQDNYTMMRPGQSSVPNYESLVPASFTRTGTDTTGDWSAPIHTFGFGNDHDAAAMHVVAESTGGTFSYIENEAVIQDAFAQCIGGLLTVVVQEARIAVASGHPGVRISSVKSGRYESRVDEDGLSATIAVGELYADEERRFLVFLSVPPAADAEPDTTLLIKVSCSYRDAAGGTSGVNVSAEDTVVARPEQVVDAERSMEVERERVRVEAAEDIAAARAAAERGAHQEAVEILENRQRMVEESGAARSGDPTSAALGAELREMRRRVASRESYARSGRAFVLAGISMHAQQRASMMPMPAAFSVMAGRGAGGVAVDSIAGARRVSGAAAAAAAEGAADEASSFATPAMRAMLLRSRRARETSAEDTKAGEGTGGKNWSNGSGKPVDELPRANLPENHVAE